MFKRTMDSILLSIMFDVSWCLVPAVSKLLSTAEPVTSRGMSTFTAMHDYIVVSVGQSYMHGEYHEGSMHCLSQCC